MDIITTIYLAIAAVCVIGAIVAYYFIGKNAKKGTVLVVGAVVLILGKLPFGDPPTRETELLKGTLGLSGFIGVILGFLELLRKPQKPKTLPIPKPPKVPTAQP